jgi:hypothetical protein
VSSELIDDRRPLPVSGQGEETLRVLAAEFAFL